MKVYLPFFLCYNNYCSHWKDNQQCLFCNLVSTKQTYQSVLARKKLDQIGETARAAFAEGTMQHMLMTGGCFPGENETDIVVSILNSVKKYTGMTEVPGCVLASPPGDLTEIERLRLAGIQGVGYSLEMDIYEKYQLPPTTMHCYRCDGNTLFHEEARRRQKDGNL